MKKFILLLFGFAFSLTMIAQGKSADHKKNKEKAKTEKSANQKTKAQTRKEKKEKKVKDEYEKKVNEEREKKVKEEHSNKVWDGTTDDKGKGPKASKNQPAKVREAFLRDYPNAANVSWSKYRGDWTATFGSGLALSTAVYHANGERRDTRTPITQNKLPQNVLDSILKRRPGAWLNDIIKIDLPNAVNSIFRIKDNLQGNPVYYYNSDGLLVKYDY